MSSLEQQIKEIENNIIVKEGKIQSLLKDIEEIKNKSQLYYENLIDQQDILLKKKKKYILLELKINNLIKNNIKTSKNIHHVNIHINCLFDELKNTKCDIKDKYNKFNNIFYFLDNYKKCDNNIILITSILNNFFRKKNEHNILLKSLLDKNTNKKNKLVNNIKEINSNINNIISNILILDEQIISNLNKIKNVIYDNLNIYQEEKEKYQQNCEINICLNIINKIIEKQQNDNNTFLQIYNISDNIHNNIITSPYKNDNGEKLQLELNTQEFLELENFFS
ncbi:hypothetical protein PFAG_04296 [Plasmodium falciparum Santa Lucia]|uniref:Uncharacterized protein n=13 Tax=Plasmodium falciparum TaxID=5833 RepID=Q8IEQ7_PLAF7|nr:conserved Plasmodium protein, unknown function [Plasmodium falciparum 3D7]ETW17066.1 hypothetical protein PFFVO_03895 [Plasmodium falciparum Vietnam Oak-Knoll (FVO)]ETW29624.1 hypothetical protein PFFCH_02894 [Plasmodium falciparum FCH/4]ETW35011.1 hypothetical protein PFTANZ_04264 [Plasmodium falciparum Tanzania (2000708)]ETW41213.1 hypothetical protein PFNF135_04454 [Plasmodium falciparum NF135/5.C10]ETW54842.1 hypothetical protein PFUGPA_03444 [Plasmodium falciparum Palo Alto/Uganda]ETW|eukprot:XP_001349785.1 conserved Plasmodium protein, unknown function [Plasmodium falciparum 3D7]